MQIVAAGVDPKQQTFFFWYALEWTKYFQNKLFGIFKR